MQHAYTMGSIIIITHIDYFQRQSADRIGKIVIVLDT